MENDNLEGIVYDRTFYDICYEQSVSLYQKSMENYFEQNIVRSFRKLMGGNEGIHRIKNNNESEDKRRPE